MARTRTTIGGRVVSYCGRAVNYYLQCGSDPSNAVPTTSQDSSAVADNPVLDETATTSADLGVCYTNADKTSEQSEAQKTDSNQQVVDMDETSRLVKEDVPSQPANFSTNDISSSSSATSAPPTSETFNPPSGDLKEMLKYLMEYDERKRQQREKERKERERKDKEREERWKREDEEREERWRREDQERGREHKEYMERSGERHFEFMERAMDEYEKQMKHLFGIESVEKKTVTTTTSENETENEIKMEESKVSEEAAFENANVMETETKASELNSFQTDLDTKDSPWDGPQDNVLVRDLAINSAEKKANEYAENVCCEALDGFTSMDDSLDSNFILVGGKRSTPEPESRMDATISENPSASDPSWIFKSPESGEKSGNPDFESHIIEAQLCDDFFRDSLPMVFSMKNRSVTVTKIGVVQFLGENTASFSATQCFIPYNDNCYGFFYDSVRTVSSCGSSGEQKVWFGLVSISK